MKILQIARQFEPSVGGIESVVGNLVRGLQARGVLCTVLALNRLWGKTDCLPADEIIGGIQIYRVPYVGSQHYALAPFPINYLKPFDLVHLHSSDFFLDYLAISRFIHQKPIMLTTHGLYFHSNFAKKFKRIYFHTWTRLALTQVARIITDSQQDFRLVSKIAPREKIEVIPNGVSPELLEIFDSERIYGRILSIGRLSKNKRYDALLKVFARSCQIIPELQLIIIGKDEGERARLENLANELGIRKRIELIGEVSPKNLREELAKASVWAMASEYESFGMGLLEGMAAGCLPVVSQIPAHAELVMHGQNGFLANFEEPDRAAEILCLAVNLSETARCSLQYQARLTSESYTWPIVAGKIEQVYQKCLTANV
ncbi:MAG TPA: glycosyltransferase family 4 protein [Anaerolineaceae bacterium]|nr:glycosyltransferase family 4 protein [Anaerolineaceae bacterium]